MNTDAKHPMPVAFDITMTRFLHLLEAFSEKGLNTIPYKGSWTAAQVADHVTRSNRSIVQALDLQGTATLRMPDERAPELEALFLDLTTKFQSPDFILPGKGPFDPVVLVQQFGSSATQLRNTAADTILAESIQHPAFGEITKLELLYFVVYHVQRHTRQLQHIYETVEQKQYRFFSFLFIPPSFIF